MARRLAASGGPINPQLDLKRVLDGKTPRINAIEAMLAIVVISNGHGEELDGRQVQPVAKLPPHHAKLPGVCVRTVNEAVNGVVPVEDVKDLCVEG